MSTRIFGESTLRQSAEQQLKTVRVLLERDVELTSFWLINVAPRDYSDGTARDGLSMVGLSDWSNTSLFQAGTQRPAWDRQIVWYATEDSPARLIRQIAAPPVAAPASYLNKPYENLRDKLSNNAPESTINVLSTRYLSADILEFEAVPKYENATLRVKLHLRPKGNYRAQSMEKSENHLQVDWIFHPKNTWPTL